MKHQKTILTLALAVTSAALLQTSALAFDPVNGLASNGDLFLGFEQLNSTTNLVSDLGSTSLFEGLAPGTTINLTASTQSAALTAAGYGSFDISDLSTAYSGSLANVQLGLAGDSAVVGSNEVFLAANGSTVKPSPSSSQGPLYGNVSGLAGGWNGAPNTGSDISDVTETGGIAGTFENVAGTSGTYSYTSFDTFANYSSTGTETLSLYDLKQGASSPVDLGTFTLDSAGDLSFTASSPVATPEPSTYALFGLSGLAMIIALRRRNALKA